MVTFIYSNHVELVQTRLGELAARYCLHLLAVVSGCLLSVIPEILCILHSQVSMRCSCLNGLYHLKDDHVSLGNCVALQPAARDSEIWSRAEQLYLRMSSVVLPANMGPRMSWISPSKVCCDAMLMSFELIEHLKFDWLKFKRSTKIYGFLNGAVPKLLSK